MAETTDSAAGAAEAAGHAAESSPGLPQLDFATFPNQLFWLIIALVAIYVILDRVALPRIAAVLAERQGTITNHIAAAEDLKAKAAAAEEAYEKALSDARSEAHRIREEVKEETQAELQKEMEKADARIAEKTAESEKKLAEIEDSAAAEVENIAADVARALVSKLSQSADPAAVDAAVKERVKG